jgi:4-amino-4-deoxy-L-arabinose transferase-like glycosyltransferase
MLGDPVANMISEQPETRTRFGYTTLALMCLVVVGVGLRVPLLGARSFDGDEVISATYARLDWPTFRHQVSNFDANMALYYVALRPWARLGGSDAVVRAFSVIPGVAALLAVYTLGARWFGTRTGLVAALLLAFNGLHVVWSQSARTYTLVTLFVTLSAILFMRSIEAPSARRWMAYVVVSALAAYAHFFAALVVVSQWVSLLALRRATVPWKGVAVSAAVILVAWSPLGFYAVTRDVGQTAVFVKPTLRQVAGVFNGLAGGYVSGAPLALYAAAGAAAVVAWLRIQRRAPMSLDAWRYVVLLSWLFVPVLIALGVSQIKSIWGVRFFTVCIPAFTLLAAIGIAQARRRAVFAGALLAAVILGSLSIRAAMRAEFTEGPAATEQWKEATAYVLSQSSPGDVLFFYAPKMRTAFDYYRRQMGRSTADPVVVFPEPWVWDIWVTERLQTPPPGLVDGLSQRYPRIWLILSHDHFVEPGRRAVRETILASLARQYPVVQKHEYLGIRVHRYSKQ